MSKREIIEKIAKERWVEKIARHFKTFARNDLCQYTYLYLLEKVDEGKIVTLYENKQLKQYITGLIYRQVVSSHSHYIKTYGKTNLSIDTDAFENHSHAQNIYEIPYDDTYPHQKEDDVDKFLSKLSPLEQDMCWIMLLNNQEKKEEIDIVCRRYGITYNRYKSLLPKLKTKWHDAKKVEKQKHKYTPRTRHRKVNIYDKITNKLLIECKNVEDAYNYVMQHTYITRDMIYKVLNGIRKSAKGYIFVYVD